MPEPGERNRALRCLGSNTRAGEDEDEAGLRRGRRAGEFMVASGQVFYVRTRPRTCQKRYAPGVQNADYVRQRGPAPPTQKEASECETGLHPGQRRVTPSAASQLPPLARKRIVPLLHPSQALSRPPPMPSAASGATRGRAARALPRVSVTACDGLAAQTPQKSREGRLEPERVAGRHDSRSSLDHRHARAGHLLSARPKSPQPCHLVNRFPTVGHSTEHSPTPAAPATARVPSGQRASAHSAVARSPKRGGCGSEPGATKGKSG